MKLFMFGTVGGAFIVGFSLIVYLWLNKSAAFHRTIEARREALRRREMNMMEVRGFIRRRYSLLATRYSLLAAT
jgi:hypothetical protein